MRTIDIRLVTTASDAELDAWFRTVPASLTMVHVDNATEQRVRSARDEVMTAVNHWRRMIWTGDKEQQADAQDRLDQAAKRLAAAERREEQTAWRMG